jgi:hypothetical protein
VAVSFVGGGNRSIQRKPPTCTRCTQYNIKVIIFWLNTKFLNIWSGKQKQDGWKARRKIDKSNIWCYVAFRRDMKLMYGNHRFYTWDGYQGENSSQSWYVCGQKSTIVTIRSVWPLAISTIVYAQISHHVVHIMSMLHNVHRTTRFWNSLHQGTPRTCGRFPLDTPVSPSNKTDRHELAEMLLISQLRGIIWEK